MSQHPRPIWLTEGDIEYLGGQRSAEARAYLRSKWDAAPADATKAVMQAHKKWRDGEPPFSFAQAVLAALGAPHATQG